MDVRQNTALRDGDAGQQLGQLLVISNGQLDVPRTYTSPLVVLSGVAGQLQHLNGQVLEHSGQVDRSAATNSVSVVTISQHTVDSADRELQAGTRCTGLSASSCLAPGSAFSMTRHLRDRT